MTTAAQPLTLEGVTVDYGKGVVVEELDLHVEAGEIAALLGESGCGKSTTLRVIAGLLTPSAGTVRFGADDVTLSPPWERQLGLVFQNHALFPHLTVLQNVEFGLRARRVGRHERKQRAMDMLEIVHMDEHAGARPGQLSGGQSQRVALARALVGEPRLLLLDEPFSSLDANLRERMRSEVTSIVRQVGVTTVMVTHDQDEALSMADKVAVMSRGRILEVGSPREIYLKPRCAYTAAFVGASNLIEGKPVREAGRWIFRVGDENLLLHVPEDADIPESAALAVKPEHVELAPGPRADHRFDAVMVSATFHGAQRQLVVRIPSLGDAVVRARCPAGGAALDVGAACEVGWSASAATLVSTDPAST